CITMKLLVLLVTLFYLTLLSSSPVTAQGCRNSPDNSLGVCTIVQQCPELNSIYQQVRRGGSGIDILRRSLCGNKTPLKVCCPQATRSSTSLPNDCGINFRNDRIINGHDAGLGTHPWMVVFRGSSRTQKFWFCGGVLITDRHILTAAHCFTTGIKIEFVRIGEYDISTNPDRDIENNIVAPQHQDINVAEVIKHEQFGAGRCRKCNDIAIVKLASPARFDKQFVQPICLPVNPQRDMGFRASQFQNTELDGVATGWGITDPRDIIASATRGSNKLQEVYLRMKERSFCQQQKRNNPGLKILCAGEGDGRDTCRADSGGPLMLTNNHGQKWFAVGITSFSDTVCGSADSQTIFTDVYQYIDWIKQKLV
ncbi:unnamed protein product, partial [Meganyctiphanes norvegica]